jgi:chaperonin cofactor prefoldin
MDKVQEVVARVGAEIMSKRNAVTQLAKGEDVDQELEDIQADIDAKNEIELQKAEMQMEADMEMAKMQGDTALETTKMKSESDMKKSKMMASARSSVRASKPASSSRPK